MVLKAGRSCQGNNIKLLPWVSRIISALDVSTKIPAVIFSNLSISVPSDPNCCALPLEFFCSMSGLKIRHFPPPKYVVITLRKHPGTLGIFYLTTQ